MILKFEKNEPQEQFIDYNEWEEIKKAANKFYKPRRFTIFLEYEIAIGEKWRP